MKRLLCLVGCCSLALACTLSKPGKTDLSRLLEVRSKELIPEGIAVHGSGRIYLGSLHQNKIVSIDNYGNVRDLFPSGRDGFMWGLGMKFTGDTLWACSADGQGRTALFSLDVKTGALISRFTHDSARFLNDLVLLRDGRIFITDTERGAVFSWEAGVLQPWLQHEQLKWANGIAASADEKYLFVTSGRYGLQRVDIERRAITSATNERRTDYAIDGLVYANNKLYAAIGWPQDKTAEHRILRYRLDSASNFLSADTLAIDKPWLNCITTLALHEGKLFSIGNTNLGIYNRHQQKTDRIRDSLAFPVVARMDID